MKLIVIKRKIQYGSESNDFICEEKWDKIRLFLREKTLGKCVEISQVRVEKHISEFRNTNSPFKVDNIHSFPHKVLTIILRQ